MSSYRFEGACPDSPIETIKNARGQGQLTSKTLATVRPLHQFLQLNDPAYLQSQSPQIHAVMPTSIGRDSLLPDDLAAQLVGLGRFEFRIRPDTAGVPRTLGGRHLLWFTTLNNIEDLQRAVWPDRLRDALGLVHFERGQPLVLVTFAGQAAQDAGDYRPIACDSDGSRFMVRSSKTREVPNPANPWGQAADLALLEDTALGYRARPPFDGAGERVVRPLTAKDLACGTLTAQFLKPLIRSRGSHHSDDVEFTNELFNMRK